MVVLIAQETGELKDVTQFSRGIAGAEFNVAIGLTRLGHSCTYITRLGTDPFGQYIYESIKAAGIDYSNIYLDEEHLTGLYLKSKPLAGDPATHYYRKNSAASYLSEENIERVNFREAKLLHITGISPALSQSCTDSVYRAIMKAHEANMIISFDPNIRKVLWKSEADMKSRLNDIASKCDIVLPGIEEGRILTGMESPEKIADFYLSRGSKVVVIKLGKLGAYFKSKDDSGYVKGFKVENVVDTVGAGDGFASGFLSGMLQGRNLKESIVFGNAVASIIIQSKGDNADLPSKEQLDEYIKERYIE
ncbi:MAG: 2-dehydro-3-deoxygluconokinase [Clostridia bacterium]|jgi:2-dehydro-3-deoxygluconokinase|nr:2-dehydro-3-deoxygluconokinase [Clostridia bacterium]